MFAILYLTFLEESDIPKVTVAVIVGYFRASKEWEGLCNHDKERYVCRSK